MAHPRASHRRDPRSPWARGVVHGRPGTPAQGQPVARRGQAPLLAPRERHPLGGQPTPLPRVRPLRPDRGPNRHRVAAGGRRRGPASCLRGHRADHRPGHKAARAVPVRPARPGGRAPPSRSFDPPSRRRLRGPVGCGMGRLAPLVTRPLVGRHRHRGEDDDPPVVQPHRAGHPPGGSGPAHQQHAGGAPASPGQRRAPAVRFQRERLQRAPTHPADRRPARSHGQRRRS